MAFLTLEFGLNASQIVYNPSHCFLDIKGECLASNVHVLVTHGLKYLLDSMHYAPMHMETISKLTWPHIPIFDQGIACIKHYSS